MIYDQIKDSFSNALWHSDDAYQDRWSLQSSDQHVIHFNRTKLTKREEILLSLLLDEASTIPKPVNENEKQWHLHLLGDAAVPECDSLYTATHFRLEQPIDDVGSFREAVLSFFSSDAMMIWETATEGVLLFQSDYDDFNLYTLSELIESDFYTGVHLCLGVPTKGSKLKEGLQFERDLFFASLQRRGGKPVFSIAESGLNVLIHSFPDNEFEKMRTHFFPEAVLNDRDLIHTIKVYVNNNMNATQTAKELHLHRNSLQYRVDKFSAQTGLDLRIFFHAVLTALLLYRK